MTYNGARFDLPMLDRWMRDALGVPLVVGRHYDLMAEIVRAAGSAHRPRPAVSVHVRGRRRCTGTIAQNARAWEGGTGSGLVDYNRVGPWT